MGSLSDFAPPASKCGACNLEPSVLSEVEGHRKADPKRFTYPVISRWLSTIGADVSEDTLRRHFGRHVA